MAKMPIRWVDPPEPKSTFRGFLLLALTVSVLTFCAILLWR